MASIVVPVIARAVSAPSIPSTLVPIKSVAVIDVAVVTVPKSAIVVPLKVLFLPTTICSELLVVMNFI